jgi:hypothetical protein
MQLYLYDGITKEYITAIEAYIDPEETKITGEIVYMYPANSTDIPPLIPKKNEICIFEDNNWVIKADYRGQYQCNEYLEVSLVENIGDLQEGFILITEEQAKKIEEDKLFYIVQDGKLVENPNYEAEKAKKERERIGNLKLTKREVFLGLYQAKGVEPEMIKAQITDPQALIEFEYANDYYRGNPLIDIVGATLGITSTQLDKFFEFNDYTYLLPVEEETNETESDTDSTDVSV